MRSPAVLLAISLALATGSLRAQSAATQPTTPVTSNKANTLSPAEKSRRDALLKPGMDKLQANDPAAAYALFGPARAAFPADPLVLRLSAETALRSGQYAAADDLFTRALASQSANAWQLRLGLMLAEAREGKWDDFDKHLAELRTAKTTGADPQLANSSGFIIDQFEVNGEQINVAILPGMASKFHTLYRFLLPKGSSAKPSIAAGVNSATPADPCHNPDFRPYIDLESDDADQAIFSKAHPDLAAQGGREFSLDSYPAPCTQGLIRFYDGEPRYETLRADLIQLIAKTAPAATAPTPTAPILPAPITPAPITPAPAAPKAH